MIQSFNDFISLNESIQSRDISLKMILDNPNELIIDEDFVVESCDDLINELANYAKKKNYQ